MKILKKSALTLLCILTCAAIIVSGVFSVGAAASVEGYGTFEEGIIPNGSYYTGYHNPLPFDFDTFPNADFQQGLMYWTTCNGRKPTDNVKLMSEGNNYFIQIAAKEQYDGIEGIKFIDDRIEIGDNLVTIYDWRGAEKHNIQIYINQYGVNNRLTGSGSGAKLIKAAEGANGWNTSVGLTKSPVKEPDDGGQLYIGFGVQAFQDPTCTTQVDNIRIGKVDLSTNDVHDLDGNFICNLGPVKGQENKNSKPASNKTEDKNKTESSKDTENVSANNTANENGENGDKNIKDLIMIIVASLAGVAIIAVIVVAIITLKKPAPKKSTKTEEEKE